MKTKTAFAQAFLGAAAEEERPATNPWLVLFSVSLGLFMAVIDISILNIALPQIAGSLNATLGTLEWTLISYTLALTGLVPVFGRVSDVLGRKRLFVAGVSIFALGSLLAALSTSIAHLILARLVQAVGGALISANTLAIITDTFPAGRRGVAMGVQAILISGGAAIGPTLGGFLVTHFGWQAVFYVNVPIGLVAASLSARILPPLQSHRTLEPLDWPGGLLLLGGLTSFLLAITQGSRWGWTSPSVLGLGAGGLCVLVLFTLWELRAKYPLIDLSLFGIREFRSGQLAGLFATVSLASMTFLFPFYWQGLRGLTAQEAGLLMLPLPAVLMVVAPLAGRLSDRLGARIIASVGLGTVALGLFLISGITADMPVWGVLWRLAVMGAGLGTFMAPNNNAVMSSVPPHKRGIASGLLGTFRFTGQSVAVAYVGAILSAVIRARTGFGGEALPSPEVFQSLSGNPVALKMLSDTLIEAMRTVSLATIPLTLLGLFFSLARGGVSESFRRERTDPVRAGTG